ncbi:unnamed protein product, partial [Meganyctiphanes norvegica]
FLSIPLVLDLICMVSAASIGHIEINENESNTYDNEPTTGQSTTTKTEYFNQDNTNSRASDVTSIDEVVPNKIFLKSYNGAHKKYNHPNKGNGLYSFYFHIGDNEREEEQQSVGEVVGKYAYIAPEGQEYEFKYGADLDGYRVESPALPQIPEDTPDVKKAKADFFTAYEKILKAVGDYDYQYNQIEEKDYASKSINHEEESKNLKYEEESKNQKYEEESKNHKYEKEPTNYRYEEEPKSYRYEEESSSSSEESSEESDESQEHYKRAVGYNNQHLGVRFNPYG